MFLGISFSTVTVVGNLFPGSRFQGAPEFRTGNENALLSTLAPPGEYDWIRPARVHNPTANRLVQPFLHSSRQKVMYFTMGDPIPQIYPFLWGIWIPI